ncbi:hypothetical protein D8682_05845 [Buttiauxella sp. 3AFRM03]|uniref:hypothetical protein n=1 Tax=Buttiauxella sp. 3AFRM03 TaxID=2479367 RepID=UPI000EF7FA26|nr:hypothetical protein [Buttiauxella sp. 3AFRM03]AYN26554.1 hypothetical protein D8682_05845 [Buttiauxella sp. 3AFRM03]
MMESFNIKNISLQEADRILTTIVGCRSSQICKIIDLNKINPINANRVHEWEELADNEILHLLDFNGLKSGNVYIITDLSYIQNIGVFIMEFHDLEKFVKGYYSSYKECFFDGDVIIISIDIKEAFIFDHNGFFFNYRLPLLN